VNTTDILLLVLAVAAAFWPKLGPILGLVKKNEPASSGDLVAKLVQDILAKLDNATIPAGPVLPAAFDRSVVVGRLLVIEADLRANGRPRTAGLVAAAAADLLVEEPKTP
jgi:hypothetical protein